MKDECETCDNKDECLVEFIDYFSEAKAVYQIEDIDGLIPWVLDYKKGTKAVEVSEFYSRLNAAVLSTTADISKVAEFKIRFNKELFGNNSPVSPGMKDFLKEELPDMYSAIMSYFMDGWMSNSFKMFKLVGAALDIDELPFQIVTVEPENNAGPPTVH